MKLVKSLIFGFLAAMAVSCVAMIPLFFGGLYFSGSGVSGQNTLFFMVCGAMLAVFGGVFALSWWLLGGEENDK